MKVSLDSTIKQIDRSKERERQKDGQMNRGTDRNGVADRWADKKTRIQMDRGTDGRAKKTNKQLERLTRGQTQ